MGWFERDWYLGEHRAGLSTATALLAPQAVWREVCGWCQDDGACVQLQLIDDPGREGRRALQQRADQLTAWLNGVRISPRFPSPLFKAARRET